MPTGRNRIGGNEMNGVSYIEITQSRYEELVGNEKKLELLENAISQLKGYTDIDALRTMFGIDKREV